MDTQRQKMELLDKRYKNFLLMIYEINHMWTAEMKWNEEMIVAVNEINASCVKKPEKNSGFFTLLHKLRSLRRSFLRFNFLLFKSAREKITTNWISILSGNIFKLELASVKIGPFRLVKYSTRGKKSYTVHFIVDCG